MKRPTSVTVFGILNIVFAAWGVLGLIASIALFAMPADSNNPAIRIIHDNPGYAAWLKICIPLGMLSCMALLAAGIGLFASLNGFVAVLSKSHTMRNALK